MATPVIFKKQFDEHQIQVPLGEVPREGITPEVASSPLGRQQFGDGTNDVFFLRATVNPPLGSDVTAATRLSQGYPEVFLINPGDSLSITSEFPITSLYVVAVGDAESATLSSGEIVDFDTATSTAADYQTAQVKFEFNSTDLVKTVVLEASERYSATTAGAPAATANYVDLIVRGMKHAS